MDVLAQLFNACDPMIPAEAGYYVDCHRERGGNAFVNSVIQQLKLAQRPLRFLFSGHIGCGKSSELYHLRDALLSPVQGIKFFPLIINAEEYMDEYDGSASDIFFPLVAELSEQLTHLGIGLRSPYLQRKLQEIGNFLQREVEVDTLNPDLLKGLGATFKLLPRNPDARSKVRALLEPQTSTLLEEVNQVFNDAKRQLLQSQAFHDLVVIFDNLEKIRQLSSGSKDDSAHAALFLGCAGQLTSLNSHIVYTVPISLVRSRGTELEASYGTAPFVLPMVKVEDKEHQAYLPGYARLREIVRKRAGGDQALSDSFEPEALDWLIRYSGGDIRGLMRYIRAAIALSSDACRISLKAAQRSLSQTVANYSTSVKGEYWPKLAQLEANPAREMDNRDPDYRSMLEQLVVLEYINGGQEESVFDNAAPWYAVHPIVRELKPFKSALAKFPAP